MSGLLLGGDNLHELHDDGRFHNTEISRIIELIREYDHRLDVKWIPENFRHTGDPAFAITERLSDGREVVAFYVQSEEQFNEAVLTRIYMGDNTKQDVQAVMEAKNKATRALAESRWRDELDARIDFASTMMKSGLHTYRHNGKKYHL